MKKDKHREPRIILWDIETLPDLPEVMEVFPSLSNYPGLTLKATINSIICVGWKVFGKKKVNCINAWDYPKLWKHDVNNDFMVCKAAYDVLKNADVVVTHNGKRFDWKFLQTRLIYHKIGHLPKLIHIDTCQEAKKHLLSFNNRLNTLGKFLAHSEKKENGGWPLWVKVMNRDPKAQRLMSDYCKQDVRVLEQVFATLKPLITQLPNHNLFTEEVGCPNCGSHYLTRRGFHLTKEVKKQRYQCQDCGTYSYGYKDGLRR